MRKKEDILSLVVCYILPEKLHRIKVFLVVDVFEMRRKDKESVFSQDRSHLYWRPSILSTIADLSRRLVNEMHDLYHEHIVDLYF